MSEIKCPRCKSTQLSANKQGFGVGKALTGAVLTGGIGLLAGGINSNKVNITCLQCGHSFRPGNDFDSNQRKQEDMKDPFFIVMFICVFLWLLIGVNTLGFFATIGYSIIVVPSFAILMVIIKTIIGVKDENKE